MGGRRRQLSFLTETKVLLPAALKANTGEADADVKESGFIQVLVTWKMRDSHLKAHLNISV